MLGRLEAHVVLIGWPHSTMQSQLLVLVGEAICVVSGLSRQIKIGPIYSVQVCNLLRILYNPFLFGVWRSLAARFVRVEEVAGSSPATPTSRSRTNWAWPF